MSNEFKLVPTVSTDEIDKAIRQLMSDEFEIDISYGPLSRLYDAILNASPQPPALGGEPEVYALDFDLDAAARKLAECMDYPWAYMPEPGRDSMRAHAKSVIDAALSKPAGSEKV